MREKSSTSLDRLSFGLTGLVALLQYAMHNTHAGLQLLYVGTTNVFLLESTSIFYMTIVNTFYFIGNTKHACFLYRSYLVIVSSTKE